MLKGKNLELRALEPADVDLLYQWENDGDIWHVSNTATPFSRFMLEQYVLNAEQDIFTSKQLRLMIAKVDGQERKTIGNIDLFAFDPINKRAGIGILITSAERKKGHASEAIEILVEYCFDVLHLHQVYCNISVDNVASLELFKRSNFKIVGVKKDWLHIRDKWVDEYLLQRVKER